jgi:Multiubiquitin
MAPEAAVDEKKATYEVNIEGTIHDWEEPTITVPQIRKLAGWDQTQQVIEVDTKDNSERTLGNDETVKLKPGKDFGKKIQFKRG